MSEIANSTPGPWKFKEVDGDEFYIVTEAQESPIAQVFGGSTRVSEMGRLRSQRRANAARIVRCVNAHDELLAACKDMRERFKPLVPVYPGSPAAEAISILDAAIAKAEAS